MYSIRPNLMLGFHGCRKEVALSVAASETSLEPSKNDYDWLGGGIYFWENDYDRALEFAKEHNFKEPYVLGAVFHLGYCLDLTSRKNIELLKAAYNNLIGVSIDRGTVNQPGHRGGINGDLLLRFLDCSVIEAMHQFNADKKMIMAPALKTKKETKPKTQTAEIQCQEPKRLSKSAIWRLNNPNGIITVVDWRAVNK